jgi:hypothetical protein
MGVFAALSYDVTSANLSSPQTFELNVNQRGPTLNKWLNINVIEALALGAAASLVDKTPYPLIGSGIGIISMFIKYHYAMRSGQRNAQPDMENTQTGSYNLGGSYG